METTRIAAVATRITAVAALIAIASLGPLVQGQQQQAGIQRTDLQRHDLSIPGYEEVQDRVDFAPGYTSPKHKHPGEEIIYVLEGTLEYQLEGQAPVTLKAGDVLLVPSGVYHSVKNVGTVDGAELGTYVVEKGKPLFVLAEQATDH